MYVWQGPGLSDHTRAVREERSTARRGAEKQVLFDNLPLPNSLVVLHCMYVCMYV